MTFSPTFSPMPGSVAARIPVGDHDLPGVARQRPRPALPRSRFAALGTAPGLLLGALVVLLVLAPLLAAEVPPLLDYPDHLARAYIIQNQAAEPLLQRWYQVTWRLLGNLGGDIFMLALTPFMSVEAAGRLLLAAIQASTLAGTCLLHRALWGRWSLWPLAAIPVLWHGALMAGFLNFSLSIGFALLALAAWVAMAERPLAQRIAAAVPMGLVLYFTHLMGFAIFGVLAAGIELVALRRRAGSAAVLSDGVRRLLLLGATAALPMLVYLLFRPAVSDGEALGAWTFGPRARGLLMPLMGADETVRVGLTLLYAAGALFLARTGRLSFRAALLPGMAVLGAAYLILPGTVDDNGHVPERIGIAMLLVAIAASRPQRMTRRAGLALGAAVALACLAQSASVTWNWRQSDVWYQQFRQALAQVPVGAKLLVAAPGVASTQNVLRQGGNVPGFYVALANKPALSHMPSLAVTRGAFVPLIFTHAQKQILAFQGEVQKLALNPTRPVAIAEAFRAGGEPGPALSDQYAAFDAVIVLYADLLSPAERQRVAGHGARFDNGSVLLVDNRPQPAHQRPQLQGPEIAQR